MSSLLSISKSFYVNEGCLHCNCEGFFELSGEVKLPFPLSSIIILEEDTTHHVAIILTVGGELYINDKVSKTDHFKLVANMLVVRAFVFHREVYFNGDDGSYVYVDGKVSLTKPKLMNVLEDANDLDNSVNPEYVNYLNNINTLNGAKSLKYLAILRKGKNPEFLKNASYITMLTELKKPHQANNPNYRKVLDALSA